MFPDGMPDLQSLMSQAAEMQQRVVAAQQELEETRVEGSAGGGLVRATVTGTGELFALTIDPDAVDPDDTETLADLVVAAVRDAAATAQQRAADQMGEITGGFGGGDSPLGQLGF
jgi:DNA-binding YbaB/EbfC family protein